MLTDIGNDDRFVKLTVDFTDNIKRSHHVAVLHGKRMLLFPFLNLFEPFAGVTFLYIFIHLCDCFFCVSNDRNVYMDVSGNGSSININVYDLGMRSKLVKLTSDTVIETGSDGEQEITFIYSHICRIGTMHTKISDEQRVFGGDSTTSHNGSNYRYFCLFNNLGKNLLCMGDIYTTACKKQRFFCFLEHFQGTLELSDVNACVRFVAADVYALRILCASKFCHHIFRKVDEDRSRTAGTCDVKSFFNNAAEVFTVSYGNTVFCDASCNADDINLLERVVADEMTGNLTGEAYERNTVVVGSGKTCDKVGGTRTAGYQAYADFSCGTGIGICLMDKSLLVTWQDDVDAALFI